jgi:hypothetical protein
MSDRALQVLSIVALVLAGTLFVGVSPAYACHEATGWCCVDTSGGDTWCCHFQDDQIDGDSCFKVH